MSALFQGFPSGGRWTKQSFGRMRGASCFLSESLQSSGATCSPFPCFPLRESLLRCCQASAASRVARSAERGLFKTSPYVAASPCLKKIQRTSFFSAKMGILSLRQGFPLLLFAIAKISKNCQPCSKASHRGEAPPRGGGEGRILFSIRIFSIKWRNLFAFPLFSPSGLTLPNCRLKPNPASKRRAPQSRERSPTHCVFLKNRQSGGKNFLAAALIFNRCFRYSGNR